MRYLVSTIFVMVLLAVASCGGGGGVNLGLGPGDTTAPDINITGATDGTAYGMLESGSNTLTLHAVSTDASGINNTSIRINGTLVASENASSASFVWDVTGYADGQYLIEVQAYDAKGNLGSDSIEVAVNNVFELIPLLPGLFPVFPLIPVGP